MNLFKKSEQPQQEKPALEDTQQVTMSIAELNELITKATGATQQVTPSPDTNTQDITQDMLLDNYKRMYETESTKTQALQAELAKAQKDNLTTAQKLNYGHKTQSVSDILRGESYHPLHKAK